MSLEDPLVSEAIKTIADAVNKRRADVVHTVLTTAAESVPVENEASSVRPLQAILDYVDDQTGTCLHHATKSGCVDIVRALLAAGADPSIRDKKNKTAYDLVPNEQMRNIYVSELLQAVAHQGQLDRVRQLLDVGVDVNSKDGSEKANTALHFAATYAGADMIRCLCEHGADMNIANGNGITPLQDAMKRGDSAVLVALLEQQQTSQPKNSTGGQQAVHLLQSTNSLPQVSSQTPSTQPQQGVCMTPTTPVNSLLTSDAAVLREGSSNGSMSNSGLAEILDGTSSDSVDSRVCVWPPPQLIIQHNEGSFPVPFTVRVYINACQVSVVSVAQVWKRSEPWFHQLDIELELDSQYQTGQTTVSCTVNSKLFDRCGSYKLTVLSDKVILSASDATGLWYGIHTFIQLCRNCQKSTIPTLHISDWPCLSVRGVMIDLSGGRMPDLEALMSIVDTLSTVYRVNRLQLRMVADSTNAPGAPETVEAEPSHSSISRDILALTEYCSSEFVELVPHFEDNSSSSASSLPASLEGLLPSFSSSVIHLSAGCSVPSFSTCQHWLNGTESQSDIEQFVATGRTVGVIKLEEVGNNAEQFCNLLTEQGLSFLLSSDTSIRNSVCYNWAQCVSNARLATSLALQFGSPGVLITDWGEHSYIAPLAVTLSAVAIGAGFAWTGPTQQAKLENQMITTLNRQVFMDESNSIGQCVVAMAKSSRLFTDQPNSHCTIPFRLLVEPSAIERCSLSLENVQSLLRIVRRCHKWLSAAKLHCFHNEIVQREVTLTLDILTHSSKVAKAIINYQKFADNPGNQQVDLSQVPATQRTDLANKLLGLIDSIYSTRQLRNQGVRGCEEGGIMKQLQQVADELV